MATTLPTLPFFDDDDGVVATASLDMHHNNSQYRLAIRTGALSPAQYSEQLFAVAAEFYDNVPANVRSGGLNVFNFSIRIFFEGNPDFAAQAFPNLPTFANRYHNALSEQILPDQPIPTQNDHARARLQSRMVAGNLEQQMYRIRNLQDLRNAVFIHVTLRERLRELYTTIDQNKAEELRAIYHVPTYITFTAHRTTMNTTGEDLGDRSSHLFREILDNSEPVERGYCFWHAVSKAIQTRCGAPYTEQDLARAWGRSGRPRVTLADIDEIEKHSFIRHTPTGSRLLKNEIHVRFVIHDLRLKTRRLCARSRNKKTEVVAHLAMHNQHVYAFRDQNQAASITRNHLTFYGAFLLEAKKEELRKMKIEELGLQPEEAPDAFDELSEFLGLELHKECKFGIKDLHDRSWDLFMLAQHLQPDMPLIREFLCEHLGLDTSQGDEFAVRNPLGDGNFNYIPRFRQTALRMKELRGGRDPGSIAPVVYKAPHAAPSFDMRSVICMDLETLSLDEDCKFLVYSGSYKYELAGRCDSVSHLARDVDDLQSNGVVKRMLSEWVEIAGRHAESYDAEKARCEGELAGELRDFQEACGGRLDKASKTRFEREYWKRCNLGVRDVYVYAHNGSRFDAVAVLHSIVSDTSEDAELPTDQLYSNGKFISFTYKGNLVFRDSCLIVMSSLDAACRAWGVPTTKGYLPHRYLQCLRSHDEALQRIHATVTWRELEPYMDWFSGAGMDELQSRDPAVSYDDWKMRQPVYKWWLDHAEDRFEFLKLHDEYLAKDVECLWHLVRNVGTYFIEEEDVDIRVRHTVGSIAEHLWLRTLAGGELPKLQTEAQHLRWQQVNRGGWCSVLHSFDYTVPEGLYMYTVDVTSLYPAASMNIEYVTEEGLQRPLYHWYRGFPDPSDGWLVKNYAGAEMDYSHYDELYDMHGLIEISFDQTECDYPVLLKKMQCDGFETLAPITKGREYYTIPHVRYAFDHKCKIWLHKAEYTTKSREVYGEYMTKFAKMKNDNDKIVKDESKSDEERAAAQFRRTSAKLMLNSLLGRNNMSIHRMQHLLTRSTNDIIALVNDDEAYSSVVVEDISCGDADSWCYAARFREGDYKDNVSKFNVLPYLSGYMLGYSKMLLNLSLQFLATRNAALLYTDTDSITFACTRETWTQYRRRFVPLQKTLGGMDVEAAEEFTRFVSIGAKKYAKVHPDGSYVFKCNGLQPKSCVAVDVLAMYERILKGETVGIPFFSIQGDTSLNLKHASPHETKKLRFVNFKAAEHSDDCNRIRWWNDEAEFEAYAKKVCPIGWEDHRKQQLATAESASGMPPPIDIATPAAKPRNRTAKPPKRKRAAVEENDGRLAYVYILKPLDEEDPDAYVGFTHDLGNRLRVHNSGQGGQATAGKQWRYECAFAAPNAKDRALRLESILHLYKNKTPVQLRQIALDEIAEKEEFRDFQMLSRC